MYGMRWVICRRFMLLARVRCFLFLSTAHYNSRVIKHRPWEMLHRDAIRSSRKFGHDMLYYLVFVPEAPIRTFQSVYVSIWRLQIIRKEFGESNGDYEGTAARETHSALSDEKRTPEFVGKVKTMTDNDPSVNEGHSQGHRSIWVSYQTDSAWRQSVFLIQDAQGPTGCHTSRILAWLSDNFSDKFMTRDMWPNNSPDWNPLDGEVERDTNKTICNTKDELKARIMATFTNLKKEFF